MRDAVTKLEEGVLGALARGEAVDACALQFLLRRYQRSGRPDLGETVGAALAVALDTHTGDASMPARAAWLALFVEATALSDDDRLVPAIADLVAQIRPAWTSVAVEDAAMAIGACLHAAGLTEFQHVAADAIDQLERVVGRAYHPGEHVGSAAAQVRTASALLIAYGLSGRLPYSMLAEELIQTPRRDGLTDFADSCEAARVLCRLATLHDDPDYRAAAIIAPGADYRHDAQRLLAQQSIEALRRGAAGAIYGVALLELESPDSYVT